MRIVWVRIVWVRIVWLRIVGSGSWVRIVWVRIVWVRIVGEDRLGEDYIVQKSGCSWREGKTSTGKCKVRKRHLGGQSKCVRHSKQSKCVRHLKH